MRSLHVSTIERRVSKGLRTSGAPVDMETLEILELIPVCVSLMNEASLQFSDEWAEGSMGN